MATVATPMMTAEEFFEWANRPENAGKKYELENGEVVEMSSPGEAHALVCWFAIAALTQYVFRRGSGHILTNDGGLIVRRKPDFVRGPDVMLFLENLPLADAKRGHTDRVPALIVEVFSPTDRPGRLNDRIGQYHRRGIPLVWVVYPDELVVNIHRLNEPVRVLDESDELTGDGVLPDFRCRIADLFALPGLSPPPAAAS